MPIKKDAPKIGIHVSLQVLFQIAAAVLISYLLTQILGMDSRVKVLEMQMSKQEQTTKSLWEKKVNK